MSDDPQCKRAGGDSWLDRLAARHTPPCTVITRLISESLDRRLSPIERLQIRLHARICVWCSRYEQQLTGLRTTLLRGADQIGPAASLSPAFRAQLKSQLAEAWAAQPPPASMPRVWIFRFALAPAIAFVFARTSQWCITCVEIDGAGGSLLRVLHAVLSWPMFMIRLLSTPEYTPTGFPLCCFGGWSGVLILLVAAWHYMSTRSAQAEGRS